MNPQSPDETQESGRKLFGRRGLLLGAFGAAGAALLGKTEKANADVSYVALGATNSETSPTVVANSQSTPGVVGTSNTSPYFPGVTATAGLVGASTGLGVFGAAPDVTLFTSSSFPTAPAGRIGVLGSTPAASQPETTAPVGVFGMSDGIGVLGNSDGGSEDAIGVRAEHTGGGTALDVLGKARFSTAGNATIPQNANSVEVSEPSVGANSIVLITFLSNPQKSTWWVKRQPGVGFTLQLSSQAKKALDFSYLVAEPGVVIV